MAVDLDGLKLPSLFAGNDNRHKGDDAVGLYLAWALTVHRVGVQVTLATFVHPVLSLLDLAFLQPATQLMCPVQSQLRRPDEIGRLSLFISRDVRLGLCSHDKHPLNVVYKIMDPVERTGLSIAHADMLTAGDVLTAQHLYNADHLIHYTAPKGVSN